MRKRNLMALAGIVAAVGAGGTWAYFNQTLTAENVFDTGKYDNVLVEDFKPKDGETWEPGSKVNKDVHVTNTGDYPVVVRVKFAEKWVGKDDSVRYAYDTVESLDINMIGQPTEAAQNKFENVYQMDPVDGKTGAHVDDSVVYKTLHLGEEDGNGAVWVYNETDGYYYYSGVIGAGQETGRLLDDVTLSENVDMGLITEKRYYSTDEAKPEETATPADAGNYDETGWIEFDKDSDGNYVSTAEMADRLEAEGKEITYMMSKAYTDPSNPGYSNAEYTLTITAQTVQATRDAAVDIFGEDAVTWLEDTYGMDLMEQGTVVEK